MISAQVMSPPRTSAKSIAETRVNPHLIEIMGQSNAAGVPGAGSLPAELQGPMTDVYIYNPQFGVETWQQMNPGINSRGVTGLSGTGANDPTGAYGVEARLMYLLRNVDNKPKKLIKYAISNTPLATQGSILDWNAATGGDELFNRSNANSLAARTKKNDLRSPRFIIWIQGENDANNSTRANAYATNLRAFIAAKRSFYGQPNLPFIFARLGNMQTAYSFLTTVQTQQDTVAGDANCYIVNADGLATNGDDVHYNAASIETLSQRIWTVIINNNL